MKITLADKNHPLINLLKDAVMAARGGSTSRNFIKAMQVPGWAHVFGGFGQDGYSIEILQWQGADTEAQLKDIYCPQWRFSGAIVVRDENL
jgi:hypothetical protein